MIKEHYGELSPFDEMSRHDTWIRERYGICTDVPLATYSDMAIWCYGIIDLWTYRRTMVIYGCYSVYGKNVVFLMIESPLYF